MDLPFFALVYLNRKSYKMDSIISTKQMVLVLESLNSSSPNYLFVGNPGIGKSQIIYNTLKGLETQEGWLVSPPIQIGLMEVEDIMGIPRPTGEDSHFEYLPPKWLYELVKKAKEEDRLLILFWDELNRAKEEHLNALLSAFGTVEQKIGDIKLPKVVNVCTANPPNMGGTADINEALMDRLIPISVEVSPEMWLEWATLNGIDRRILAFLRANPALVYKSKDSVGNSLVGLPHPNPRRWVMVNNTLSLPTEVRDTVIISILGPEVGNNFLGYCESLSIEAFNNIPGLLNREVGLPKDLDGLYVVIGEVARTLVINPTLINPFVNTSLVDEWPIELVSGIVVPVLAKANKSTKDYLMSHPLFKEWAGRFSGE